MLNTKDMSKFNVVNLTLNSVCIKCILYSEVLQSFGSHCLSVNLICIGTAGRTMVSSLNDNLFSGGSSDSMIKRRQSYIKS